MKKRPDLVRHLWWALPVVAVALAACGKSNVHQSAEAKEQPAAVPVRAALVVGREEPVTMASTGTFVAPHSSVLTPAVEGLVASTPASLGAYVAQGSPIVVLDPEGPRLRLQEAEGREREAAAALAQAEARLGTAAQNGKNLDAVPEVLSARAALDVALAENALAQTEETRSANLLRTGDVSRASYDRAVASLRSAEARVASARQQLDAARNAARQGSGAVDGARAALLAARAQTGLARKALADSVVRAPFSGFLTERTVGVGEYVTTASKLGRLERLTPLKLQFQVPEAQAARLQSGQIVRASVDAYATESFSGRITTVNASLNATSRTLLIEATFDNTDRRLKPGMFATAVIELGGTKEHFIVPASAVQQDNRTDTFHAWVLEGSTARLRLVQPARKERDSWVLVTGVRSGDRVVTGGNIGRLADGTKVTVETR